ncbi:MAG: polysaccharide pyruvyl transferase family protein [Muribaculum sp.]|nr:polysaccharide pyruvyl transferase family protein [Muribaculum sp.]
MTKSTKILYIEQPLKNRGDESAHRGIIRWLNTNFPDSEINIVFWDEEDKNIIEFIVDNPQNKYINLKGAKGAHFALINGINYPTIWHLHPSTKRLLRMMEESDYILCAPGGVNMGGFQGWEHLAMLKMGIQIQKPVIYYGRSVGPFPEATKKQKRFLRESVSLLNRFTYLSVRDQKSSQCLTDMKISHSTTVDCAFLNKPTTSIPDDIRVQTGDNYAVIVPNNLYWHYAYKDVGHQAILGFYVALLKKLLEQFPTLNFVMLPQTYSELQRERKDYYFFKEIQQKTGDDRVIVLSESISSDIQQSIIGSAKFLFGSRYHSVVFAINQGVPFMALSYEHKISGLLDLLNLKDYAVSITSKTFQSEESINALIERCMSGISNADRSRVAKASIKATTISLERIKDLKKIIR